ncbi:MAG: hypothetical protein LBC57_06290 [Treponema sp.]|jgi:predicted ATPase|nr:hypothetical protein [Treponema sp.]
MILRKIAYHEFDGRPNYWALKPFELGKINLLVGKNATGKTNTITKIGWLGNMLAGLQPQLLNSGSYDVVTSKRDTIQHPFLEGLTKWAEGQRAYELSNIGVTPSPGPVPLMSTSDRFVMNAVPLEYWQVIQRKGGEYQVFNYQNSKEKIDDFEYTGLNNFDFLRTDFINSNWESV